MMYNPAWCNHVDVQIIWWMEKGDMWVAEADVSAWSVVHLQAFMSSSQSPSMSIGIAKCHFLKGSCHICIFDRVHDLKHDFNVLFFAV